MAAKKREEDRTVCRRLRGRAWQITFADPRLFLRRRIATHARAIRSRVLRASGWVYDHFQRRLAMKRFLVCALLCGVMTLPAFAALKQGDKAPDFSARASLAGKEFAFSLKDALKK